MKFTPLLLFSIGFQVPGDTANYIVLYLSATENASVLFPIVSLANVVAVWLVGLLFFKEKLTLLQTGFILYVPKLLLSDLINGLPLS